MSEIIIVGAGASGLMAADQLIEKGYKVTVLEARDRTGGRIHTIQGNGFSAAVETGAEFIHGKLPVTLRLVREAKAEYYAMEGHPFEFSGNRLEPSSFITEGWDEMSRQLEHLQEDMTVSDFLQRYFSSKDHETLRDRVINFVSGYDAADPSRASTFALRDEWFSGDEDQFRIRGGYYQLIEYLVKKISDQGGVIHLSSPVSEIQWQTGNATVTTVTGRSYSASKVFITIPLPLLDPSSGTGAITFHPSLPDKVNAVQQMGYGGIVKVMLGFNDAFWRNFISDSPQKETLHNASFIFSQEKIPTWWTQFPEPVPLLTGWCGGPAAEELKSSDDESILVTALQSLATILHADESFLRRKLAAHVVANWPADPFSRGAYSYSTVQSSSARKVLKQPVDETLFFAGEALYEGTEMGTVEAALVSAMEAVKETGNPA